MNAAVKRYPILRLTDRPEIKERLADWFHEKWGIDREAYLESMDDCLSGRQPVPQWYCVMDGEAIIGGLGVIENDFHDRKDLRPNVCAVFVEEPYRRQGIAGRMLAFVCQDMARRGIGTLYLLTDHTGFYERCGWKFLCMAQGDGDAEKSRIYMHNLTED